jgi:hypothetical protein
VPANAKTEAVAEMEDYFRELIRGIDSSLLEEWERLRRPELVLTAADEAGKPARPTTYDITRDAAAFRRLVRTAILGILQDVAGRDWESAASRLASGEAGPAAEGEPASPEGRRLAAAFGPYVEARGRFRLDPEGRSAKHTHWAGDSAPGAAEWTVSQVLIDAGGQNDWETVFAVSLPDSRAQHRAVVRFERVSPIGF